MSQLQLRSSSFHEHCSSFRALGFLECGSGALFFHGSGSNSGFYSFSHYILIVLVCLKMNGKLTKSSTQNHESIPNIQSNLIWLFFTSRAVTLRKSAKKQHTNNFWKDSRRFCLQCLRTFCYFFQQNQKMAVWKTTFVSEHLNTDQSQLTKCFTLVVCFACCSIDDSS